MGPFRYIKELSLPDDVVTLLIRLFKSRIYGKIRIKIRSYI